MKLIGSYTSPFVRKISVILLEKRIPLSLSTNPLQRKATVWRAITRWARYRRW